MPGSSSMFRAMKLLEGTELGVRVLYGEVAVRLSCPQTVPSSLRPHSLWASWSQWLTMVWMSQLMSSAVMGPLLGSAHWTTASLSSSR